MKILPTFYVLWKAGKHIPLTVVSRLFKDANGDLKEWFYITRRTVLGSDSGNVVLSEDKKAVTIVGTTPDGDFVLIKQLRFPLCATTDTEPKYEIGFPAGLIDPGESPEDAADREMREETGYKITKVYLTTPALAKSSGLTDEKTYFVYCEVERIGESTPESDEDIEVILAKDLSEFKVTNDVCFGSDAWNIMFLAGGKAKS